jgi:hypothetical protein
MHLNALVVGDPEDLPDLLDEPGADWAVGSPRGALYVKPGCPIWMTVQEAKSERATGR